MKLNSDMLMKVFLGLVVIGLIGYLIYSMVINYNQCHLDRFKSKIRKNVRREGFQTQKTLQLFYANWCPHCKQWVNSTELTSQYINFKNQVEALGLDITVLNPVDCAPDPKVAPQCVNGYPTWVANGSETILPTVDAVRNFFQ